MNLKQAVVSCFSKYVTFSGRAPRSEYWYFALFNFIASFVLGFIEGFILGANGISHSSQILCNLYALATFLPGISVIVRRLHDTNRSGWWQLIIFTIIGIIPFIYWMCKKGTAGDNRFGPDPLANFPA